MTTTTWAVGRARLLELAAFLDNLESEKWNFESIVTKFETKDGGPCGTVCCALGWTPAVWPKLVKWHSFNGADAIVLMNADDQFVSFDVLVSELFGISFRDACGLFYGGYLTSCAPDRPWLSKKARKEWSTNASIKQVVSAIRAYVRWRDRKITKTKTKKAPSRRKAK